MVLSRFPKRRQGLKSLSMSFSLSKGDIISSRHVSHPNQKANAKLRLNEVQPPPLRAWPNPSRLARVVGEELADDLHDRRRVRPRLRGEGLREAFAVRVAEQAPRAGVLAEDHGARPRGLLADVLGAVAALGLELVGVHVHDGAHLPLPARDGLPALLDLHVGAHGDQQRPLVLRLREAQELAHEGLARGRERHEEHARRRVVAAILAQRLRHAAQHRELVAALDVGLDDGSAAGRAAGARRGLEHRHEVLLRGERRRHEEGDARRRRVGVEGKLHVREDVGNEAREVVGVVHLRRHRAHLQQPLAVRHRGAHAARHAGHGLFQRRRRRQGPLRRRFGACSEAPSPLVHLVAHGALQRRQERRALRVRLEVFRVG
mmetsp:Transcript_24710/g.77476  ORF Transcript_24710/g.77476 Transcript_24710/m.77476 type:complete len:375 (-) Transcript_24710:330-1454(-)